MTFQSVGLGSLIATYRGDKCSSFIVEEDLPGT